MFIYYKAAELANSRCRLLDIGTKDGRHFVESEAKAVGIDIDIPRPPRADISMCLADGSNLPFRDDTFDIVVANQVFEHVPPDVRRKMLAETVRVLTSGGRFLCSIPNRLSPIVNHGEPIGFQYLPRPLATTLASVILEEERAEEFIQGMFHISSFRLRWLLNQYFEEVKYDTPELGLEHGPDVWPGTLNAVWPYFASLRVGRFLLELGFSYAAYSATKPIKSVVTPQS